RRGGASHPAALFDAKAPEWWLVVDRDAVPAPELVAALAAALEPHSTAAYSDFRVEPSRPAQASADDGVRADVGAWSKERSRWQDYAGAVALIRGDALTAALADNGAAADTVGDLLRHRALVHAARLGQLAYVRAPLYRVAADDVIRVPAELRQQMIAADRAGFELPSGMPPRQLTQWPSVSIVIPTRGGTARVGGRRRRLIDVTMRSFIDTTGLLRPEFVLVVDDDVPHDYVDPWRAELGDRLRIVTTSPPFNFSAKVNLGVAAAGGEVVAILNDDMSAVTDDWLRNLVAAASEPDVGAVGALLLLESGDIQHAGHHFTATGPYLLDVGRPPGPGPRSRNDCDRDVTGVTAACLVQRRQVWAEVGGMDEAFPVSFNDVDYCERISAAGYRVVQCNSSRLFHYESRTRKRGATRDEIDLLVARHGHRLGPDALTPYEPPPPPPWREQASYRWNRLQAAWSEGGARGVVGALRSRGDGAGPAR
ncbi:MAG: hypothetical protein RLZ55_873, partial [Actinomycetota bacterium]